MTYKEENQSNRVCPLCGEEIEDFDDGGIYEGEYCEMCFQEAQESRL